MYEYDHDERTNFEKDLDAAYEAEHMFDARPWLIDCTKCDGSWAAVMNVIALLTGKDYKSGKRLTVKGKREALADCIELLATLEHEAVIYEDDNE